MNPPAAETCTRCPLLEHPPFVQPISDSTPAPRILKGLCGGKVHPAQGRFTSLVFSY